MSIKLKKSSVPSKVPLVTDLDYGELALNYADGKLYYKNASNVISSIGGASSSSWIFKTSAYTASAGDSIVADTTGGAFTITLPASPSAGDEVKIADGGDFSATSLIIGRNSSTIEGLAENLEIDVASVVVTLVYSGTTWNVFAAGGPSYKLESEESAVNSNLFYPTFVYNQTSGIVPKLHTTSTKLYFNPSTGTLSSTSFNYLSDATKKTDIRKVENALSLISEIDGVHFCWKDNGNKSIGVIAQNVESVLPELVETNDTGTKTVNYAGIIGVLIEAVKELKEEVEVLRGKAI